MMTFVEGWFMFHFNPNLAIKTQSRATMLTFGLIQNVKNHQAQNFQTFQATILIILRGLMS